MGSTAIDGHKDNSLENIDEKTLLQVNASMVVGVLILLTLSAFAPRLEMTDIPLASGRLTIGLATLTILLPFIISALTILTSGQRERLKSAKRMTAIGFVIFGVYLALIIFLPTLVTSVTRLS